MWRCILLAFVIFFLFAIVSTSISTSSCEDDEYQLGYVMPMEYNLSEPLTPFQVSNIRHLLSTHLVIVFKNQTWSTADQHRVSLAIGDGVQAATRLQPTLFTESEDLQYQGVVHFARNTHKTFGFDWHSDMGFNIDPSYATILFASVAPAEGAGGETKFADTHAAYNALTEEEKDFLEDMNVLHSYKYVNRINATSSCASFPAWREQLQKWDQLTDNHKTNLLGTKDVMHPLIRVHHMNNRKCLYPLSFFSAIARSKPDKSKLKISNNNDFCEQWKTVYKFMTLATEDSFVYTHKWETGDVVMWDNVCTLHQAQPLKTKMNSESLQRVMRRTSTIGPVSGREVPSD
eukprot:m.92859 g.92859  ORF g.92859 m.92859 type:complete len:346 (-) comp13367_c0_seq4:3449-4486(-)